MNQAADYNKEAAEKFDLNNAKLNHLTREAFETSILQLTYEQNPSPYINREVVLQKEYAAISYHVTVQRIQSTCKGFIGWVYMFQDTTKQKMMYNALENMSAYDPLTGFYTSRIFANKLAEWNKNPEEYIIAICNIAGLKLINAFYDRKIGDEVIQRMSEEIRNVIPEDALICYSADDSTVIVAKDITEEQMNLYLSIAAGKIKKYGLENVPVFLNYGIARRENTSIAIEEYIKYASMDLLLKKGRDPRDELPAPILMSDVMSMEDLKPGMTMKGTVRNVIDFGAFVDIGVHQDGLVHISHICDRYIKHPLEVLSVGDIVKVKILDVDLKKKRISLSMKEAD